MQFFIFSAFSWMFVETLLMYLLFVRVWHISQLRLRYACLVGWGFPTLATAITIGTHYVMIGTGDDQEDGMWIYTKLPSFPNAAEEENERGASQTM